MKFVILAILIAAVLAQKPVPGFRAPSVPLIVQDPYMRYFYPTPASPPR